MQQVQKSPFTVSDNERETMAYELFMKHYGRDGLTKNAYISPLSATYSKIIGGGSSSFVLHEDTVDNLVPLSEFDILEYWIRNIELGIVSKDNGFVRDYVGVVRDNQPATNEDGETFINYFAPRGEHILSWRHVLWPSGVSDRSKYDTVAAETIMKSIVEHNLTASATTVAGRWRDGDLSAGMGYEILIDADLGRGNALSKSFTGGNALGALRSISQIDKERSLISGTPSGDFSLDWQGGNQWLFVWHEWQLGDDKTSGAEQVVFSLSNQTMRTPTLRNRGAVATVTVAAGRGEGVNRLTDEVLADDYIAGTRDLESFSDVRNEQTQDARIAEGQSRLRGQRSRRELDFDVLQTSDVFYSPVPVTGRKTYKLGDLVLANYAGLGFFRKITRVQVNWTAPTNEDAFLIDIDTQDTP